MRFARVLVPVDFSAHARAAAAVGRRIARQTGGQLTLLHVDTLPELALLSAEPFYIAPQAWELLRRNQSGKLDKEMADLVAELGPGVDSAQTTGQDVVGGILTYAD